MALSLGEILIKKGYITPEELKQALQESRRTGRLIGETLIKMKFITQRELLEALSEQLNIPFLASLKEVKVSPELIKRVPVKFVQHYKFMPLELKDDVLTIAVSDPLNVWLLEDLKLNLGYQIERVLTTDDQIEEAIRKYYGIGADTIEKILAESGEKEKNKSKEQLFVEEIEKSEDASVIKLVNQILTEAIQSRATDIHFEPYRDEVKVRYRIDGILYEIKVPEDIKYLYPAIVSRIKIMARLDVIERRLPQDGRIKVKLLGDKEIDLRISIIPGYFGENVVIRILPVQLLFNLEDLGLFSQDLEKVEMLLRKPHGIIFLTGPTGSGKTTTLYAFLARLNKPSVKIITIEDPVEYALEGITQIQVNPKIGLNFATALRSILRHDPDIMMIGEVRDLETAELAIRTALTGHLVFSTLHTNDACSGITRLLDIGIEPYLVSSSVRSFIAQRLVRVICPNCKEKRPIAPEFMKLGIKESYYGKGCQECRFTGFKGRTAIFEILFINEEIKNMIVAKKSSFEIKKKVQKLGRKTLREYGLEKVRMGITTLEEVLRVTELEE